MVFPGRVNGNSINDHVFVLVTDGSTTRLQHWVYSESNTDCNLQEDGDCEGGNFRGGGTAAALTLYSTQSLTGAIGGDATGYATSAAAPPLNLAIATMSGRIAVAQISRSPSYNMLLLSTRSVSSAIPRAPFWCHCPGQDLIGFGGTNGTLYVLDSGLNSVIGWYDGTGYGESGITTTPVADANGDWYFGADDGYVYNVELPAKGQSMFMADRFGPGRPGSAILSSPIVGSEVDGCARDPRLIGHTPCLYFGSISAGVWFAKIGSTRVMDVRVSCLSAPSDPATCVNPRLWAQIEVGYGVKVRGWSYYAP
jgi:hypothetical protein